MNRAMTALVAGYLEPYFVPGYELALHWDATVTATNLILRPDLLTKLGTPLRVTSGIVGSITIEGIISGRLLLRVHHVILEVAPGAPTSQPNPLSDSEMFNDFATVSFNVPITHLPSLVTEKLGFQPPDPNLVEL